MAVGMTADRTTTVTRSENWVLSMIPAFRPYSVRQLEALGHTVTLQEAAAA
jgi:hypothetical protein